MGSQLSSNDQFLFAIGRWVDVDSSNVHEICYDEKFSTLYIGFHGGKPEEGIDYYAYPGVAWDMAHSLAVTSSYGTWVWDNLRGRSGGHLWPYYLMEKNKKPKKARR